MKYLVFGTLLILAALHTTHRESTMLAYMICFIAAYYITGRILGDKKGK